MTAHANLEDLSLDELHTFILAGSAHLARVVELGNRFLAAEAAGDVALADALLAEVLAIQPIEE